MHDKIHMGCGAIKMLDAWWNVDLQHSSACDECMDLSVPDFPAESASHVFSNAFFEHLYVRDRVAHVQRMYEVLKPGGFLVYTGIPYFPAVAKAYLEGQAATTPNYGTFDLYHVWRYTHGAPEEMTPWEPQVHKGLFDKHEFRKIFEAAQIPYYDATSFNYSYPGEPVDVKVTSGFIIRKLDDTRPPLSSVIIYEWEQWSRYINTDTMEFHV